MSDASSSSPAAEARAALAARADAIEEAYEFMLAYASQGLSTESGSSGSQVREYLRRFEDALDGLGALLSDLARRLNTDAAPYDAFIDVLERDARDTRAALRLVLAQPVVHSQLIDNLNASIHVRALLTDLFLIDEILKG